MPYVIIKKTKAIFQETKDQITLPEGREFHESRGLAWSNGRYNRLFDVEGQAVEVEIEFIRWRSPDGHLHEVTVREPPGPSEPPTILRDGAGTPCPSTPASERNYDGGKFGRGEW